MSAPSAYIGSRRVAHDEPVYFIAELSANHGGSIDTALKTIDAAKAAGADAIKLQTYTPDTLTLNSDSPLFVVKTMNEWAGRTLHDLYAEAMTPWEWHARLKQHAESLGMDLFSTPFDATATQLLADLNVTAYKIASFELVDLPLVEHVARRGQPMIMSTGMATLADIEAAVAVCRKAGNHEIVLLRCVSAYPARPDTMDLESFHALRSFGTVLGLSDHTRDATVAIASVALGARVIEKHFILDRNVGGPDAFFSLEPADFRLMVDQVRATEKALGRPRFGPSADEKNSVAFRRSLFVAKDVKAGELLTHENVRSVRPSNGISPRHLPFVLGKPAARDLAFAQPLAWDMVAAAVPADATSTGPVRLRKAGPADSDFLFGLRNEPLVRAMSLDSREVARADHDKWLAGVLEDASRHLYVIESADGTTAYGQVRLDAHEAPREEQRVEDTGISAEVSISLIGESRGKGIALAALRLAEERARQLGIYLMTATIRPDNAASLRLFTEAGFYNFVSTTTKNVTVQLAERRLTGY